jgi:hypothetical protein
LITSHTFFKAYQRPNVAEFVAIIQKPHPKNTLSTKAFKECCDCATNLILRGDECNFCDQLQMFVTNKKARRSGP